MISIRKRNFQIARIILLYKDWTKGSDNGGKMRERSERKRIFWKRIRLFVGRQKIHSTEGGTCHRDSVGRYIGGEVLY